MGGRDRFDRRRSIRLRVLGFKNLTSSTVGMAALREKRTLAYVLN